MVEEVLIKAGGHSGRDLRFHTKECHIVDQHNEYRRVCRCVLNDTWSECSVCSGDVDQAKTRPSRECPLCSEEVPNLPQHMRACSE